MISAYVETTNAGSSDVNNILQDEDAIEDEGPVGELEYWRRRMQRIMSITEQIKLSDMKDVFLALHRDSKSVHEDLRQRVHNLLRLWKQVDIRITEAVNEAKDNAKSLSDLSVQPDAQHDHQHDQSPDEDDQNDPLDSSVLQHE